VLVALVVVAGGAVGAAAEQAVVALPPVVLVLPLVVIPRLGDRDFEEVGVAQDRVRGGVAAAGVAVDPGAVEVDPRVAPGQLAHPGDLIGDAVVAHVAVIGVVEGVRAQRRAPASAASSPWRRAAA